MGKNKNNSRNRQGLQVFTLCISTSMVLILLGMVVFTVCTAKNLSAYVKENLKALKDNSSMLIVSQRISTIMDADEIIVLDEGKIIDKGSHDYLNENCSIYREIVSSQIERSQDRLYDDGESNNFTIDTSYIKKTVGGK